MVEVKAKEELVDLKRKVAELTPAGIAGDILNINKSAAKAIYRRPDGNLTRPLPADPYSMLMYFAKRFTAP